MGNTVPIFNCICNLRFHYTGMNTFLHLDKKMFSPHFFITSTNKKAAREQSDARSPSLRDGATTTIHHMKCGALRLRAVPTQGKPPPCPTGWAGLGFARALPAGRPPSAERGSEAGGC